MFVLKLQFKNLLKIELFIRKCVGAVIILFMILSGLTSHSERKSLAVKTISLKLMFSSFLSKCSVKGSV